jgi:hypothetical protein
MSIIYCSQSHICNQKSICIKISEWFYYLLILYIFEILSPKNHQLFVLHLVTLVIITVSNKDKRRGTLD